MVIKGLFMMNIHFNKTKIRFFIGFISTLGITLVFIFLAMPDLWADFKCEPKIIKIFMTTMIFVAAVLAARED